MERLIHPNLLKHNSQTDERFSDKKANVINKNLKKEYYDKKNDLLVSYGYYSVDDAKEGAEKLLKTEEKLLNNKYFVISTSQFINALVFKTLDKLNL